MTNTGRLTSFAVTVALATSLSGGASAALRDDASLGARTQTTTIWTFFDATKGCNNKIRKVVVASDGTATVKQTVLRAPRRHSVTALDVRPKKLVYADFNCRTSRNAIKIAFLGPQVRKVTVAASERKYLVASFGYDARRVIVGPTSFNTHTVRLRQFAVSDQHLVWRHAFPGLGRLWGLDSGAGNTIYANLDKGPTKPREVVPIRGTNVRAARLSEDGNGFTFATMAVSHGESVALTSNSGSNAAVKLDAGVSGPDRTRVRVCGSAGVDDVTWLSGRVLLAACDAATHRSYQLVDLRKSKVQRTWLPNLGEVGLDPVGLE